MFKSTLHYVINRMPSNCFGDSYGHPQGGPLQRMYYIHFLTIYKCKIISFKTYGLKYILNYKIRIKMFVINV